MEKLKEQFSAKTISSLLLAAFCVFSMATLAGGSLAYAKLPGTPKPKIHAGGSRHYFPFWTVRPSPTAPNCFDIDYTALLSAIGSKISGSTPVSSLTSSAQIDPSSLMRLASPLREVLHAHVLAES